MKRRTAIVLSLASCVVAAAVVVWFLRGSGPKSAALEARQRAMEALGRSIAQSRPKGEVLVLSNPFTKDSGMFDPKAQFERAGIRGLRKGLGDLPVTVAYPEIRPEYLTDPQSVLIPPESRTPLSFLVRPGSVEQLADAHPECTVIVSLIGLPAGVDQGKLWHRDDPRTFALLLPDLRVLGSPGKVVEAFQQGKLLAVVADDGLHPGEPLIVTRENVSDVLQRQPQSLGYY